MGLFQAGALLVILGIVAVTLVARCARAEPAVVHSVDPQGIVRLEDGRAFTTRASHFAPGMRITVSPPHGGFEATDDYTLTPEGGRGYPATPYPTSSPSSSVSPSGSTLQARPPGRAVTTRSSLPST